MEKVLATLEEDVLTSVIDRLRLKYILLQSKVDKEGEQILKGLFITTLQKAREAADFYTLEWFNSTLYSDDLKIKIALRLISETNIYPINNSAWNLIARPNAVDVEEEIN